MPLPDEPAIDALIELGRETNKTIAVPVFSATSMHFVHFTSSFDGLPVDKYGKSVYFAAVVLAYRVYWDKM